MIQPRTLQLKSQIMATLKPDAWVCSEEIAQKLGSTTHQIKSVLTLLRHEKAPIQIKLHDTKPNCYVYALKTQTEQVSGYREHL